MEALYVYVCVFLRGASRQPDSVTGETVLLGPCLTLSDTLPVCNVLQIKCCQCWGFECFGIYSMCEVGMCEVGAHVRGWCILLCIMSFFFFLRMHQEGWWDGLHFVINYHPRAWIIIYHRLYVHADVFVSSLSLIWCVKPVYFHRFWHHCFVNQEKQTQIINLNNVFVS